MGMWKNTLYTILFLVLPVISHAADQAEGGAALHQQHCTRCHDSQVYTRSDRFITSYDALSKQVRRCEIPAKVKWDDSQVQSVIDYLDSHFYKFRK